MKVSIRQKQLTLKVKIRVIKCVKILSIYKFYDSMYEIIETTSVEMVNGGVAVKRPITLLVDLVGDRCLITVVNIGNG